MYRAPTVAKGRGEERFRLLGVDGDDGGLTVHAQQSRASGVEGEWSGHSLLLAWIGRGRLTQDGVELGKGNDSLGFEQLARDA